MPLTFKVAPHAAGKLKTSPEAANRTAKTIYTGLSVNNKFLPSDTLYLSSLDTYTGPTPSADSDKKESPPVPLSKIQPTRRSGFVQTALSAYNNHFHLVIRPDDLWISIISQFALFLENKDHSEVLRSWFTASDKKENIHVKVFSLSEAPTAFREKLGGAVVDKELIPWIIPAFTTTTEPDREVASYLLMGALKNYFSYSMMLCCGIPSVTLMGEKEDYEEILKRIDYLDKFEHKDLTAWAKLLRAVVMKAFVAAFEMGADEAKKTEVAKTWNLIAHHHSMGSGPTYLSGWITAFSFFGKSGEPVMDGYNRDTPDMDTEFFGAIKKNEQVPGLLGTGDQFGLIDTTDIAPGILEVDIKVIGLRPDPGEEVDIVVVAGSIGMGQGQLKEGKEGVEVHFENTPETEDDTVFPVNGWWIVEKDKEAQQKILEKKRKQEEEWKARLASFDRARKE